MKLHCKDCGYPIVEENGVAYCPLCRVKRFKQPVEMDPETGKWEGT